MYDLYIWDFDDTITKKILSKHIHQLDFYKPWQFIIDPLWIDLVKNLISNGKKVGIATFNNPDVVFVLTKIWFPISENETKIFHKGNVKSILDTNNLSKSELIQKIMKYYNITDKNKVVYFDDCPYNIKETTEYGIKSYHTPKGFIVNEHKYIFG